jgi:hypothetical protein
MHYSVGLLQIYCKNARYKDWNKKVPTIFVLRITPQRKIISSKTKLCGTAWRGFVFAAKNIPGVMGHKISQTLSKKVQIFSHSNLEEIEDK